MKILVLNCGSSSLKYQLIDMEGEVLLAKGICEQIGDANATFTHKVPADESKNVKAMPYLMADHGEAIKLVINKFLCCIALYHLEILIRNTLLVNSVRNSIFNLCK